MKSFTKIQNEKDITNKYYVDSQNVINSNIYTSFTPEGGTDGVDYAITIPGLESLEIGYKFTMIPHVANETIQAVTLTVNDFGTLYLRRGVSGNVGNMFVDIGADFLIEGYPVEITYKVNNFFVDNPMPYTDDLLGIVGVASGGTGATSTSGARINLGAAATVHTHKTSDITDLDTILDTGAKYKPCRVIIGSSAYGWEESQVDYLCDGTDDQVEINQAISSFDISNEKEIILLDGVYNLTSGIDVSADNVIIRGNGNNTILKRMYSEGTKSRGILDISSQIGCKIYDLYFDNNITDYNFFYNKTLSLNSCEDITISNCRFANSRTAVSLIGSTHCNITNNSFSNNNTSIDVQSNGYNIVSSNYIYGNGGYGISVTNCGDNNITGNIVTNCQYAIRANTNSSSSGNIICNNVCNGNTVAGISISDTTYSLAVITGNVCNNCKDGVLIAGHGNTISGNTCCNNSEAGIKLNNANTNTVTGNTCVCGTGTTSDYSSSQYTIYNYGDNNLICGNNIMGKDCYNDSANSIIVNNKYQ